MPDNTNEVRQRLLNAHFLERLRLEAIDKGKGER